MLTVSKQWCMCIFVVDEVILWTVEVMMCIPSCCGLVKCSAVLSDLETMWQAATKDNRRMLQTVRQTDRKLQQHLRRCGQLPGDVITGGDAELDDALAADADYDVWLYHYIVLTSVTATTATLSFCLRGHFSMLSFHRVFLSRKPKVQKGCLEKIIFPDWMLVMMPLQRYWNISVVCYKLLLPAAQPQLLLLGYMLVSFDTLDTFNQHFWAFLLVFLKTTHFIVLYGRSFRGARHMDANNLLNVVT